MNTLTLLSVLSLAIGVAGTGYLMGRVPKSFTEMLHAISWPRRMVPYIGLTMALLLGCAPLISAAADSQYLAFLTLAGALLFVIAQTISEETVDDWLGVVAGIIFFVCSTLLVGISCTWWLLFAWLVAIATVIFLQLYTWRLVFTLTAIAILYIYCLIH
jgi:hypothetical protein